MDKLSYRFLLVEDDADDRYIMHQAFEEVGILSDLKMFPSSEELIAYLSRLSSISFPELVILDYNMPAWNGAELALFLKKHPDYQHLNVVLYSTGMSPKIKTELIASGVLECFDKGMEYSEMLQLVRCFVNLLSMKAVS